MSGRRALHVAAGNLYGGVERILVEIARAPGGWRHEFAVCFDGRLAHEIDASGAERHCLGPARFSRPWTVWGARRRLRAICAATAYEAIVCHSPWPYALASPVLDEAPVLWAHDAFQGTHWTERRVAGRPPRLIVCNSEYTSSAAHRWLSSAPRTVVYAPVSPPSAAVARRDIRRAFGAAEDLPIIAIASRFERWKGHVPLLRALAGIEAACEVWIAGTPQRPHERDYESQLRRLARDLRVDGRVRFLTDRVNVPDLFAAADIHCQPNTAPEPFGIAFIEALYAGLPVVTSDAGGPREIVTADCGVLLPMGDVDALRRALEALVCDPAARARLGAAGPARAWALCEPAARIAQLEAAIHGAGRTAA
ncbi:MAG TPA: glycosyltransferase [Vicinamibacterales bacterium]